MNCRKKEKMKYIGYCRKSTDEKDKQILSIDQQIAELKEFATKQNIEISEILVEAKTAKVPGRPVFNSIVKKLEEGEIDGIASWNPDRLARNSIDGGRIIYLLDTGKLKDLKFPSFWFENSPQGKFVLNMAFGQSKYYVDNLSENVARGMRHKVRLGIWPVQAPLGYLNDKGTKTIKVDPKISKIVKKAFEMFKSGNHSFTSISEFLYGHGIKTRVGNKVSPDVVKRMLTKKFYIGLLEYKGELHKGVHKPIIDKSLFDKVQSQINRFEKPRHTKGHNFSFVGMARCGECGGAITGEEHSKILKSTDEKIKYVYYRCTKKYGKCNQKYVPEQDLAGQIKNIASDIAIPTSWYKTWLSLLEKDKQRLQTKIQLSLKQIEEDIKTVDIKLNKLLDAYLDTTIDEESYKLKKNELFEQKLKLEEKMSVVKTKGSTWLEPFENCTTTLFHAQKIASEEKNFQKLAVFVKSACSNLILSDQNLKYNYNLGYSTAYSACASLRAGTVLPTQSMCVTPQGIEP